MTCDNGFAMKRLAVLVALALAGCGGSVDSNLDGGSDAGDAQPPSEAATETTPPQPYDGTVGKACTTDADCASANGPNLARCSSSVFAPQDYYPTPVCILPSCSPVSGTGGLHFCDGPDDPSSPGICVTNGSTGGICVPKCTYDKNGGAPVGCQAHDACFAFVSATENGVGYCWAACTQDSDCHDGQKCQPDRGWCVQGVLPPTKAIGDACTSTDTNAGVCNCLYGTNKSGYCSSSCVVGGTTCPQGYTCDSLEQRLAGYSTPNVGMGGYCAIDCTADAGACPASSVCTNVFASGPDCIPP
jgi:hypothetical protein